MLRETDLLRVKLVAHTLLDAQIQETALSPVIVSHPFTNSGISALRNEDGILSMVDLINNSDDCTRWRRKVGEQIDSAENVHQIFVLLNPPYYLTFIKFAASDLSEKDLGQLLSIAWTQEECPNQDCNVSKRELVALFRSVSPEFLMDEEERTAHQALEDTVTVYRGVTPYNAKNIRALSWTLDRKTADRFAHRFGEDGTVYEAQIRKEHILALFTSRNESEAIVDPRHLEQIMESPEPQFDMKRPSVFFVTENGTTRYGMTRSYGGLAGITLRLLTHATDGYGISIPYFERLKPMKEISEDEFQTYADHPETADDLYSFAEIDVDKNVLRIDEDWKEERSYREYPLQLLLAQATPLISSNPYSGYDSLQKQRLYAVMDDAMHSYQESEDENALSEKEMDEEMSEAPSMQM